MSTKSSGSATSPIRSGAPGGPFRRRVQNWCSEPLCRRSPLDSVVERGHPRGRAIGVRQGLDPGAGGRSTRSGPAVTFGNRPARCRWPARAWPETVPPGCRSPEPYRRSRRPVPPRRRPPALRPAGWGVWGCPENRGCHNQFFWRLKTMPYRETSLGRRTRLRRVDAWVSMFFTLDRQY